MNKYNCNYCSQPKKHKPKGKKSNKITALLMIALGVIAILALFLPVIYWAVLLGIALILFGVVLLADGQSLRK